MKRSYFSTIFFAPLLIVPLAASAGVYKCVDATGRISFQEQACPNTSSSSEVSIKNQKPSSSSRNGNFLDITESKLSAACIKSVRAQSDPEKIRSYCECSAREILSDPARVKDISENPNSKEAVMIVVDAGRKCMRDFL